MPLSSSDFGALDRRIEVTLAALVHGLGHDIPGDRVAKDDAWPDLHRSRAGLLG